jgi:peptide/nickel transport system permease protein
MSTAAVPARAHRAFGRRHPVLRLIAYRLALGLVTLLVVSVIVFAATQVLPGDAAYAILGRSATPERVHQLREQLHLDRSSTAQYWAWFSGLFKGDLGISLSNGESVWTVAGPRLANSAILVAAAGVIGTLLGLFLGALAAIRRDRLFDHSLAVVSLVVTSLPEFLVGVALIIVFATVLLHVLPAVSIVPPGTYAWDQPKLLVLPVATLVIVIVPYISRMMRASMVEALESEYVEMARLKGAPTWRLLGVHALPNAIAPTIQVIALCFLYLAGGIVVVEYVFAFPGIGQGLVSAVADRDVPLIQFTVMTLAAFYIFVNIASDVVALLATPRRRIPRS